MIPNFAILLKRSDNRPALRLSPEFRKLLERGSGDTITGMLLDMKEVLERSGGRRAGKAIPFSRELLRHGETIVDAVWYWNNPHPDLSSLTRKDIVEQLHDYATVCDAAGYRICENYDPVVLVSQMTALLCAYYWSDGDL